MLRRFSSEFMFNSNVTITHGKSTSDQKMNISYHAIKPEHHEIVLQHLRDYFFATEVLNKAVCLVRKGERQEDLEDLSKGIMDEGYSIVAYRGSEVIGAVLNSVQEPGDKKPPSSDQKFNKITTFLNYVDEGLNLFEMYKVDKVFEITILSVSEMARGKGLGTELAKRSIELAKKNHFKLVKAQATGEYSKCLNLKLGFKILKSIPYCSYCDEACTPVFNVEPPHKELCVMALEI